MSEQDEAWAILRNGLSKAYVAGDIDNAIAATRPLIEREAAAAERARIRDAVEGLDKATETISGAARGPLLQAVHEAYLRVLALLEALDDPA